MELLPQHTIKGYEIRQPIGAGGFGTVYRAFQAAVGREVAIKVILPQRANQSEFVRRFEIEAQTIARLEHPHIVPLYDYWRDPSGAYLVMRWLPGTLRAALDRGPWQIDAVVRLVDQLASALAIAHREGIIHRDIKPENVLLDEDENAYLADFGIAKDIHLREPLFSSDDELAGSPAYISPEQIRSQEVSPRTDLYSFGYVLYELLTGEKAFPDAKTPSDYIQKHLNSPLPAMSLQHLHIPAAVDEVLQTATAKDPAHRYASLQRFAAAFRAAVPKTQPRIPAQPLADPLTEREIEVLRLIVAGVDNTQIAQKLFLSPTTVKWYVRQIYSKLDVHSRQQAIERALNLQILASPQSQPKTPSPDLPTVQIAENVAANLDLVNPYKGLRAFQEADSADYFGRAAFVERLLSRLSEHSDESRFLVIVGPSGSGKSSLVRAGLIPALRRGALKNSPQPFIVDFLPGSHPLEELEAALLRVAVNPLPSLMEQLQEDRRGLVRAVKRVLPNDSVTELILVVDQFEEIFTLVEDAAVRAHFIDNLLSAATDPRGRVRIILTLRADFYDRPLLIPRLAEMVRTHTEVIVPLTPREMEQAIFAPAERLGIRLETGLVPTILNDVGEQPGTLPLLQYALTELFERREGLTLTLAAYNAMGGVLGALARRADEIYETLDHASQAVARQLFLRLITLGEGAEDTRRRTLLSELNAMGDESRLEDVLNAFVGYRLLTLDHDPVTHSPTVEIAHEALIREWTRLREWLDAAREEVRVQRRLNTAAAEWKAGKDTGFLASGARLTQFENWAAYTTLRLTADERAYLQASLAERDRQQQLEQERSARETALNQRARSRTRLFIGTALATFILLLLTGFTFNQSQIAASERDRAQSAEADAQRARTVAASLVQAFAARRAFTEDHNPDLALALALQANSIPNPPLIAQEVLGEVALSPGTHAYLANGHTALVHTVRASPDGTWIVSADAQGTVVIWDRRTRQVLHSASAHTGPVNVLFFLPNSSRFITASLDSRLILWDAATGEQLRHFEDQHTNSIFGAGVSADGQYLVSSSTVGEIGLWNLASGEFIRYIDPMPELYSLGTSPAEMTFVACSNSVENPYMRVWDIESGAILHEIALLEGGFAECAYSPDGRYFAATYGANAERIGLWDAATGIQLHTLESANGSFYSFDFAPDGTQLVTADGELAWWDMKTGALTRRMEAPADIARFDLLPDGTQLLTNSDTAVRLIDLVHGAESRTIDMVDAGIEVGSSPVFVSAGIGRILMPISETELGIVDITTGSIERRLEARAGEITALAISPDGQTALVGYADSLAVLVDLQNGGIIRVVLPETLDTRARFRRVNGVVFSPNGRNALILRGNWANMVDVESGALIHILFDGLGKFEPFSAAFSPHELTVYQGHRSGALDQYDLQTGQIIRRLEGHNEAITAMLISADGRRLVTRAFGSIRVWDTASGALLREFPTTGTATYIALSADERLLLAVFPELNRIRLWDMAAGQVVATYHVPGVTHALLDRDDRSLIISGMDNMLRVWNLFPLPELVQWTRDHRYIRELTCDERVIYDITPRCNPEGIAPVPTPIPSPTDAPPPAPTATPDLTRTTATPMPSITPSVTPIPLVELTPGTIRASIATAWEKDRWIFTGRAGDIITLRVDADIPSTGVADEVRLNQMDVEFALYTLAGDAVMGSDSAGPGNSNAVLVDFALPGDDTYMLEIFANRARTGDYTLTFEQASN